MQTESAGVKVTHAGIEIVYHETENRWKFELRGRCRSAESLAKAKEYIDKPVKEKEETAFERIKAWYRSYGEWVKCEVTSVAESAYSSRAHYWITYKTKNRWGADESQRLKVSGSQLFPVCDKNDALVAEYEALKNQQNAIGEKMAEVEKKLKPIEKP